MIPQTSPSTAMIWWRAVLAVAAAFVLLIGSAAQAHAGDAHDPYAKESPIACPYSAENCLRARVDKDQGQIWAAGYFTARTQPLIIATIVLWQCDGLGRNCGAISARRAEIQKNGWATTSWKWVSPGHTYRACVSGGRPSFQVCTPLMAWNAA